MKTSFRLSAPAVMRQTTMTVTLTGLRVLRFRLSVGAWLIRIGARVIGCHVDIEMAQR